MFCNPKTLSVSKDKLLEKYKDKPEKELKKKMLDHNPQSAVAAYLTLYNREETRALACKLAEKSQSKEVRKLASVHSGKDIGY